MALFSPEFNTLQDLFVAEIQDLYDAEQQLVEALPQMADAATTPMLKEAFREHFNQTQTHVSRLERVFASLDLEPEAKTCPAMKGMIKEGKEMISAKGDPAVRDAGLIAAAQRVEHYEIAGYGSVRTFAEHMGRADIAQILQQTLDEEGETDKKLTSIAEQGINQMAS